MNNKKTIEGISRQELLEKEGWEMRFIACEPRLSEVVEAYKEAGFQVHLEPLPKVPECLTCKGEEENNDACRICFEGVEEMHRTIYTRLLTDTEFSDDDMY